MELGLGKSVCFPQLPMRTASSSAAKKNCSVSLSLCIGLFLLFQLSSCSRTLQIRLCSLRAGYLYGVCVVSVTCVALLGWERCVIADFIEQALTRLFELKENRNKLKEKTGNVEI